MITVDIDQLGQSQPGTVHDFKHGAIAYGQRIVKIDIQQPVHVIHVDVFRQMARRFRRADAFRRVRFELALAYLPVEKASQRGKTQRQARRPQSGATAAYRKRSNHRGVALRPAFKPRLARQPDNRRQLPLVIEQRHRA